MKGRIGEKGRIGLKGEIVSALPLSHVGLVENALAERRPYGQC
jgi:hypothetical protein